MSFPNRNYAFAEAFVDELARAGLRHACISPGSRSGPVALALAQNSRIKTWTHLDERSAAFFALGMAKALDEPVAVLCSSGTAAANFHPAVIEARYSTAPLLVLTADRPPELWEWGAAQTMDQTGLYGLHAKWSVAVPAPEVRPDLLRYVRFLASRAFATALESPAGPVHINMPFRDPLAPEEVAEDIRQAESAPAPEAWQGRPQEAPFAQVTTGTTKPEASAVGQLAVELRAVERGIIVCGPQRSPSFPQQVTELASQLGYPLLADPLSQVRIGPHELGGVIDGYDLFLQDQRLTGALAPEVVLRFGAIPTSKPLIQFLEGHRGVRQILVDPDGWSDPSHLSTDVLRVDPGALCTALAEQLPGPAPTQDWLSRWQRARDLTARALAQTLPRTEELFEGKLFSELSALLPEGATLFAGNSMPVRDMDAYLPRSARTIRCAANRGLNGIDGVVSTALGYAAAQAGRLVLVIGDLSFYHDMNGLMAARRHELDATIVVVNNDGGGIFSFLPQAGYPEHFEELFGTPHGLEFGAAAQLYGLSYAKVGSWEEFRSAVSGSLTKPGTAIIEVPGDRARNVDLHRRVNDAVLGYLSARGEGVA